MTTPVRLPATFRALQHRNYRLFIIGQLVSLTGTWMQQTAQAWLVYRLTGSAVLLGLVGFVGQIPIFLLAPVGGAIADRYNRHHLIVATQTSAALLAFALAGLTLFGSVQVWHVVVLSAAVGVVNALDVPARQAFLVEMVGREDLMNAIALNSSMVNGARIVGPAVAGIAVAAVGEGWCFLANAVSFVAVIAGLLGMRLPPRPPQIRSSSGIADIAEGFRFATRTAPVQALLLLLGLVSLMGMPYSVLMPVFADRILHGGAQGLGILMGASGVGALAGALMLAARTGVTGLGRWVAVSTAGFGIGLIAFAASHSFWISAAVLVPVGFAMMVQMAASNTLIQMMVPDRLRGRVMAIYSMMFLGMAPFGALMAGVLGDQIGAAGTVALGGVICIVGALVFGLRLPALRAEARQLIVAQQAAGGAPAEEAT